MGEGRKTRGKRTKTKGRGGGARKGAGRAEETKLSSVTLGFSEFPQHGAGVLTWITINVKVLCRSGGCASGTLAPPE